MNQDNRFGTEAQESSTDIRRRNEEEATRLRREKDAMDTQARRDNQESSKRPDSNHP